MLKKIYRKLGNKIKTYLLYRTLNKATVLEANEHHITRKQLSNNAVKVLEKFATHGYQAFLVGGCVRDLLLRKKPKDFDIATDASPEKICRIFPHARIIGKRFRIVHIPFRGELVEVTTFRGHDQMKTLSHGSKLKKSDKMVRSTSGVTLRDNVYGTLKKDAARRDFTVNAFIMIFFSQKVFTFGSGFQDLKARALKTIGEPRLRYSEDPVRMLRALRLADKLQFKIEAQTLEPLHQLHGLLTEVSPGRLYEEFKKMFLHGHAEKLFKQLIKYKLIYHFFPTIRYFHHANVYESKQKLDYKKFVLSALRGTDQRIKENQKVTPALLCAVFLWPEFIKRGNVPWYEADSTELSKLSMPILLKQKQSMFIPRPLINRIHNIWLLQLRLMKRTHPDKLMGNPDFRIAYNFLLLHEKSLGESDTTLSDWWTNYIDASTEERKQMIASDKTDN